MAHPPRVERCLECLSNVAGWVSQRAPIQVRHDVLTIRVALKDVREVMTRAHSLMAMMTPTIEACVMAKVTSEHCLHEWTRVQCQLALWVYTADGSDVDERPTKLDLQGVPEQPGRPPAADAGGRGTDPPGPE